MRDLQTENHELRRRLADAAETIRALKHEAALPPAPDHPYRLLFELMQQGAATLRHDGVIIFCNLPLAELLKSRPEAITGVAFHDFIDPEDRPIYENLLWQGQTRSGQGEVRLRRTDGARVPAYLSFKHFSDGGEAAIGVIVTDLTVQSHHEQLAAAHEALRESENRFREMIDALPAAVYTTDAEGRLTHFNPACVELSGRTPQIGSDHWCVNWKLFAADGTPMPHDQCPMAVALREGRAIRGIEAIAERPDGTRVWMEPYPTPVFDSRGRIVGGINMVVDITRRKVAESLTRQTEERYRALVVQVKDYAIFSTDVAGEVTTWNEGCKFVFGYDQHEFIGMNARNLFTPEDIATGIAEEELRIAAEEGSANDDRWMMARGGRRFWASGITTALRDTDGTLIGFTKVARDLTERKRADEARATLAAIVRSSDDAIIGKTLDGVITSWNNGAEKLFGYTAAEAVGRPVTMLIPPERQGEEAHILERIRAGKGVEHYETIRLTKDGRLIEISLTSSPIQDDSGRIVGASKVARDITAQKNLEREREELLRRERLAREEAERANILKDEFLATLSHELRTPLNAILGWSRLMERNGLVDPNMVKEGIQVITRNAMLQNGLISDLLDMSSIISGKIRLDIKDVELSPLIAAAVDSVRPAAEAKKLKLEWVVRVVDQPVRADPNRLQQVLWNLLTNAVKFTPEGGHIQVLATRRDAFAEIRVRDTGKGIKAAFLPHVFDRFRQGDASITREYGGLGLGLSIVRQLVDLHGGSVHVESPGEGKGSTFTLLLPFAPVPGTRPQTPEPAMPGFDLEGVQVLAVDDEADSRDLLKHILEEYGAQVRVAGSGGEALELLQSGATHVILSDIGMPEMDGYEFIRKLRASGDRTPAVAVTALARSEDRTRALVAGYHGHLAKPVESTELVATVATFARSSAALKN